MCKIRLVFYLLIINFSRIITKKGHKTCKIPLFLNGWRYNKTLNTKSIPF